MKQWTIALLLGAFVSTSLLMGCAPPADSGGDAGDATPPAVMEDAAPTEDAAAEESHGGDDHGDEGHGGHH